MLGFSVSSYHTKEQNLLLDAEDRKVLRERRAKRPPATALMRSEYLRPWMLNYAEWLVTSPEVPTISQRTCKLSQLSGSLKINRYALDMLEKRTDFQKYCDELQSGPMALARAKYLARLPKYIDAHNQALDGAIKDKDWRGVAQITESALERVLPRKQENQPLAAIQIVLSPQQLAGLSTAYLPPAVEVEALPPASDSAGS